MSMINQADRDGQATLLLVDDEPNVLRSVQRVLRHDDHLVLTADNAAAALAMLEENNIDLLITDVHMPGMDGVSLLGTVRVRWPHCMRILITGNPNLDATISAINQGEVYRYISKPWNDAELRAVVRQSLEFQFEQRERSRLEQLTQAQNQTLKEWAVELEERVRDRTARLEEASRLLEQSHARLERGFVTAIEVFSSLINQRLPKSRQTNQEVLAWVRAFCSKYNVSEESTRDLEMAAALYNLGKLTWRDELIALPLDKLTKESRARYEKYPTIGEGLLMGLDAAQKAALLVRHHRERWDGAGFPDGLSRGQIPWEARILKLAVDYVELQRGMLATRQIPANEAMAIITNSAGRIYDPDLCTKFIELVEEEEQKKAQEDASTVKLVPQQLVPDMILARPLYTNEGTLMLNIGTVLTGRLIERLQQFEHNGGSPLVVHILAKAEDQETC